MRHVILLLLLILPGIALAQQWRRLGLGSENIQSIAIDWSNPKILYAGSWNGIFKSTDAGVSWDTLLSNTYVSALAIHPTKPRTLYATGAITGGPVLLKTTDAGKSWAEADSGLKNPPGFNWNYPGPLAIDPQHPETLYTGTRSEGPQGFFRSTDGGAIWTKVGQTTSLADGVTATAVDPESTSTIYAADQLSELLRSTDCGLSWTVLLPDVGYCPLIVFGPAFPPATLFVTASKTSGNPWGLYRSTDGGLNWDHPAADLPAVSSVLALAVPADSADLEMALIGQASQVRGTIFEKPRGGPWQAEVVPTGTGSLNTLASAGRTVYAGGPGVYVREGPMSVETLSGGQPPSGFTLEPNYPNPFNPSTTIGYTLAERSAITLEVFDSQGRRVKMLLKTEQSAGRYMLRWDGRDDQGRPVASGVYFCLLRAGGHLTARPMLLLQ